VATIFETNLSIQDAKLNIVMKKLACWAAIIAVPTFVTGWFGQNVPFLGDGRPLGLWISAVLVVASSVLLYLVFRREDWICAAGGGLCVLAGAERAPWKGDELTRPVPGRTEDRR